jgi:hypothetical protein
LPREEAVAAPAEGAVLVADPRAREFELRTRGGLKLVRTKGGDICPAEWSQSFMVYPQGALLVSEHPLDFVSTEQWEIAVRMLAEGYTLGFNGGEEVSPDVVCIVASHCPFPLTAVPEPHGDDVVYIARREMEGAAR